MPTLEGARAAGAEGQMVARGYRNVGGKAEAGQKWTGGAVRGVMND